MYLPIETNKIKTRMVTSNYGLDITQDKTLMINNTASVTITLPLANTLPADGKVRFFYLNHLFRNIQ